MREFVAGVGMLGSGLRLWGTSPRLMLLGAIPALIVGTLYTALIVLFLVNLDAIVLWATPFAEDWGTTWQVALRVAAALALTAVVALVALYTFAALTLTVGDAFYERIWRHTEQRLGSPPPDSDEPWWRSLPRGVGNGLRMLALTALVGIPLFALGFVPVLGQTLVPVLAALFGGWFLALELSGFAFDARGLRLRERRRMLGATRARTLGFGVATYLLFLIPLGAVVVMPAAVAGATALARRALDDATAGQNAHPGETADWETAD